MLYQHSFFVLVSQFHALKDVQATLIVLKKIINSFAKAKMVSQTDACNSIDVDIPIINLNILCCFHIIKCSVNLYESAVVQSTICPSAPVALRSQT